MDSQTLVFIFRQCISLYIKVLVNDFRIRDIRMYLTYFIITSGVSGWKSNENHSCTLTDFELIVNGCEASFLRSPPGVMLALPDKVMEVCSRAYGNFRSLLEMCHNPETTLD